MLTLNLSLLHLSKQFTVEQKIVDQLPEPQQIRLRSLKGDKRKKQFTAGRLLLIRHLTSAFAACTNSWAIEEHVGSAPVIKVFINAPKFSLSHSAEVVGLAWLNDATASSTLLGLDIERLEPRRKLQTAHYFCNPEQLQQLKMNPEALQKRQLMTRLWTQKEAVFKAHGQSVLNSNLQALDFASTANDAAELQSGSWRNAQGSTHLSIYCDTPYQLQVEHLHLDASGELIKFEHTEIDWLPFRVTNDWLLEASN